jgi:putative peptidoglycan lipid II flippase
VLLAAVSTGAALGVRSAAEQAPALLTGAAVAATVGVVYVLGLVLLRAPERSLPLEVLRTARRRRR